MMLIIIFIATVLATTHVLHTESVKTTASVSIVLDHLTLQKWNDQSLWNKTRLSIVRHLNEVCKKDNRCDAEYGIDNIHLLNVVQYGSSSIRLNITADEPVQSLSAKALNASSSYNYTALLTNALFQAQSDMERLYDDHSVSSSTHFRPSTAVDRTSRLLFVLLGIILVATIFGLTVLFFQRIRRHSYSKLLKPPRTSQPTHDDTLTHGSSMAVLQHE